MKILKTIGVLLLALIGLFLILGLVAPKEVTVSESTVIAAPAATVFNTVNNLKTWDDWSVWKDEDPSINTTYGDKSEGVGASSSWTSDKSGAGKMTITDLTPNEKINFEMEFDGFGGNFANWHFKPVEGGTETTWDFTTKFPFPINGLMMLQGFESTMIDSYQRGLAKLKTHVETNLPATPELKVKRVDFPATHYLVNRQTIAMADMSNHFQTELPKVGMAFVQNKVKMTGDPVGLYYTWDMETQSSDMALGIPTAAGPAIDGLTSVSLPAGPALQVTYVGDYAGTPAAHEAMEAYLQANQLTAQMPCIERYRSDPGPESMPNNPEKWVTEIIYLLEQ